MTIHKEGTTSIALCILFIFIVNAGIQFYFPHANSFKWLVYILSFLLFIIVVLFFRTFSHVVLLANDKTVICPANGKVTGITEVDEPEFLKEKGLQITIALSSISAHALRNPIKGAVAYLQYVDNGNRPTSAHNARHTAIAIGSAAGTTLILRLVAKTLLSRPVWYIKGGDTLEQGAQLGFITFGSQVEVILPMGTKINVEVNEVVTGGLTVLAELNPPLATQITAHN